MASWRNSDLIDFLKKDAARISFQDKWLVFSLGRWVVCQHKYNAKRTTILYFGDELSSAFKVLKGGD